MYQQAINRGVCKLALGAVALLLFLILAPVAAFAQDGDQCFVEVDEGYLALRTAPAYDDDNVIAKLYTGDVVSVEEKRAGGYWWVYSPKFNREGYVNADYLVQ